MQPAEAHAAVTSLHGLATWAPKLLAEFKDMGLFTWLLIDLGLNWAGWAVSSLLKTEKAYDAVGSLSFLTVTVGSLLTGGASGARKYVVSGMVCLWAVRLGSYLVARVMKTGGDCRFDEVKDKPATFWVYWTVQAMWVWVTLLPVMFVNGSRAPVPLSYWDLIGVGVYAAGLAIEAVADQQKWAFKQNPENKGQFIREGLWAFSRHPNYFGEMVLWWGVFLTAARSFSSPVQWTAVASPLFVMFVLTRLSGVPILEASAEKRWGHLEEYRRYKESTSLLVPLPRFQNGHTS